LELILALLVAGGFAALGVSTLKRRRRLVEHARGEQLRLEAAAEPRGLEALRPEDVLLHDRLELLVAGVASFAHAAARCWQECRAADGRAERWLVIDDDDPEHLLIGERIESPGLEASCEPSEQLDLDGTIFKLERCGQASVSLIGDLGSRLGVGEHGFWDYARPGADRLWLRRGPGGWSCFRGRRVGRHLVTFLPGS
jgi:hypothetical protein